MTNLLIIVTVLGLSAATTAALATVAIVLDWRRELVEKRRLIDWLYEHVWDADETVPQIRRRQLRRLQRAIKTPDDLLLN